MRIENWEASADALCHMLRKHGVTWDEVDEVFQGGPTVRRSRDGRGERRYLAEGRTVAGRRLRIIFRYRDRTAQVVTAWEA